MTVTNFKIPGLRRIVQWMRSWPNYIRMHIISLVIWQYREEHVTFYSLYGFRQVPNRL